MCDDGIGIYIAENIANWLKENNIDVLIGETDFDYCLDNISLNDFVMVLDSTYLKTTPGSITLYSLDAFALSFSFSQHDFNLVKALKVRYPAVNGVVIGVEGVNFDICPHLSDEMNSIFEYTCLKVKDMIKVCSKFLV